MVYDQTFQYVPKREYSRIDQVVLSVVSWNAVVQEKRLWTLLTSAFSHFDLPHFLINNFVLYSFGKSLVFVDH